MAKFKVGDSVIYVNSQEKGIVVEICPPARGRQLYKISINNVVHNCLENYLTADIDLSDPFKRIELGLFGSYLDFSKLNTTHKINNTSNNTISSLKASNTIFKAYQFKPLLKFLNSDNRRILVADEVGLGKTIEAGHIMLELKARGEMRNAIIICPVSLKEKWQSELKLKFNLDFKIYDDINELKKDIRERPSGLKCITNYEKIREKNKKKSENKLKKRKKDESTIQEIIALNSSQFDFILFDEAHKLRNENTDIYRGAKTLLGHCKSAVFLTATPIMISEVNLYNLLRLLDPIKYSELSRFQNQITVNKPFIAALSMLNKNVPLRDIHYYLTNEKIKLYYTSGEEYKVTYENKIALNELFKNVPLYTKILTDLLKNNDDNQTRVQIQYDISDMSDLNKIFSRTRKVDVTQDWSQAIREPKTILITLKKEEQNYFDGVINEFIEDYKYVSANGDVFISKDIGLGLVQKKRQISSSVYAFLNSHDTLEKGFDEFKDKSDAKLEELIKIINEVCIKNQKKLIVFAIFIKTLKYLKVRLSNLGIGSSIIHGSIDDRFQEIENFKNNPKIQVLLSSEVGSEGLDLQFCDAIVNYDLPWNPMVVEQRIGRIDRFGQKSQIVNIYNFVVKNSIQEDIYTRLLDRIGIFRGCIGDLEAILDKELDATWQTGARNIGAYLSSLENELYTTRINQVDREKKIDQIQRAIINEQKNLEQISEGLTDTLTNDIYFKNEIVNIEKNLRYVSETELLNYIKSLFKNHLTTCDLIEIDKNKLIYNIKLPLSSPRILVNFLETNRLEDDENFELFNRFIQKIRNENSIFITFSQETGFVNDKIIRINAYHPLIIAALNCFKKHEKLNETTFSFKLCRDNIQGYLSASRNYFLAQYKCTIIKVWLGREQKIELLIPFLFDLDEKIVISEKSICDNIHAAAQLHAMPAATNIELSKDIIDEMVYALAEELCIYEKSLIDDYQMRMETSKIMESQRLNEYYSNRIKNQERIIQGSFDKLHAAVNTNDSKNISRILPAQQKMLETLNDEKNQALDKLNSGKIFSKTPELISLSLINIY
jgi:superfamily II DNA or RNA helicase